MHISGVIRDCAPKGNFCNADILGKKPPALTPYQEAEIAGQRRVPFEGGEENWGNHPGCDGVCWGPGRNWVCIAATVNGRVTLYNGKGLGLEERRRAG